VNREFTRVFEYTPQEALGRPLIDLIVPAEAMDEVQGHLESISHGQRVDGEAVRQRKNGSRLHVLLVAVPLSVSGGEIKACVMYSDITERKAADVSLQALSSRLLEVQETERQHLARKLHDEVGQMLTGLRLLLRAVRSGTRGARRTITYRLELGVPTGRHKMQVHLSAMRLRWFRS
jgi:PAS domain S-box-containing protein